MVLNHLTEEGGLNIVFLDACRDYALKSRRKTSTKGSQTTKGLVRMDSPSNAVIVYAAKEGHVAYDGEHGLSPFTEALLAKIDQPGKSMLRVLSETASTVEEATKNKPHGVQKPFLSETQLAGMNLDTESFVPCSPQDSDCRAIRWPTHTDPVRVPPSHKIAYENARNKGTIIAYYSVIEQYPATSSASVAQQDIDALIPAQFSRPPVGRNNVLEVAEIKWCLRQREWLQRFRSAATTNSQLTIYNHRTRDYNSRCGAYRFRGDDLRQAETWIVQHSRWIAATVPNW